MSAGLVRVYDEVESFRARAHTTQSSRYSHQREWRTPDTVIHTMRTHTHTLLSKWHLTACSAVQWFSWLRRTILTFKFLQSFQSLTLTWLLTCSPTRGQFMARHREGDLRQFPHQRRISVDITNPLNVVHKDSRPLHDSRAHCPCFALFADNDMCHFNCKLFLFVCGRLWSSGCMEAHFYQEKTNRW